MSLFDQSKYAGFYLAGPSSLQASLAKYADESRLPIVSSWLKTDFKAIDNITDPEARLQAKRNSLKDCFDEVKNCWGVIAFINLNLNSPGTCSELTWARAHGKRTAIIFHAEPGDKAAKRWIETGEVPQWWDMLLPVLDSKKTVSKKAVRTIGYLPIYLVDAARSLGFPQNFEKAVDPELIDITPDMVKDNKYERDRNEEICNQQQ